LSLSSSRFGYPICGMECIRRSRFKSDR
jgi:hypothetical protein